MNFDILSILDLSKRGHLCPLALSTILILLGYLVIVSAFPSISPDSGFYLKIARDLAHGASFFTDINCSYTPMAMYILSIPFYLSENIELGLLFVYFFSIYGVIGVVFYKIAVHFTNERRISLVFTLLLLTLDFVLDGLHILLEPYVVFFQLMALWVLIKWKIKRITLFASGALVFFAFFTKQYGLFILPGLLLLSCAQGNKMACIFRSLFLLFGFMLPLSLIMMYFTIVKGITASDFVHQLFGVSVLAGSEMVAGIDYSLSKLLAQLGQFVMKFPFLLVIPYYILSKKRKELSQKSMLGMVLLMGSLLPLYFDYYDHYFQLCAPYAILTILSFPKEWLQKKGSLFPVMFLIFLTVSSYKLFETYRFKKMLYQEQMANVPILKSQMPSNSKVYMHGISPAYYFLCGYDSPNLATLGYKFPVELSLETITQNMPENSHIIIEPNLQQRKEFHDFQKISENSLKILVGDKLKNKDFLILRK